MQLGDHEATDCPKLTKVNLRERRQEAKRCGLCYLCLRKGPIVMSCNSGFKCDVENCKVRHNSLLRIDGIDNHVVNLAKDWNSSKVCLGIIPVRLYGPQRCLETYALMDSGSDTSLVCKEFINQLGLKGTETSIKVTTVNGTTTCECLEKYDKPRLPNNLELVKRRLECLRKRFVKDNNFLEKYQVVKNKQLSKRYIIETSKEGFERDAVRWYVPHHPVINPKKPGKLRIVFDCAAVYQGCSPNDQLLRGTNTVNSSIGVLLRFRLAASHWGRVWEHVVRSVRRVLGSIVKGQSLTDECLETFMIEAERTINNRPLVPVTDDSNDLDTITPAKLLLLKENVAEFTNTLSSDRYSKRWKQANYLA
ncbi:unnamed protein product [Schistosoma margrebowiei]|uniref:Uncharacterized protein n=1 Tax=Schistosoma margrebowiei TaxID=48269 RepID=A0A183N180_9TREM|nr:unnamed protein product [Schistosoma margrebowiei]